MAKQKIFVISGTLVNINNKKLPGLKIEAWDKDLLFDDFVGEAMSNKNGAFKITFTQDRFKELFLDKNPDLYFKIYRDNRLIHSTEKSVLWNIKNPSTQLKITIDLKPAISDDENIFKQNARKLKSLPGLKRMKRVNENDLSLLLSSSIDQKSMIISAWKENKKISEKDEQDLRNTIDLLRMANSSIDIVNALSKDGIEKTKDLAKYNRDAIIDILKKENVELPPSKALEKEADNLLEKAERENASVFFMYRIMENPQLLDLDDTLYPEPTAAFKEFHKKNTDFDLKNEVLISLETGKLNANIKGITNPKPELIKEVSYAQNALKLSSNSDMAALLFTNQINVRKAVQTTHQSLMRQLGIDASAAIEIKRKAQYHHEAAMNGYLAYRDIVSNPFLINTLENLGPIKEGILEGIGTEDNWQDIVEQNGLKGINSIEDLFGSQNYCDCEHCKSVLGPAAYFVDLMRFTEKRVLFRKSENLDVKILEEDHPIHLKVRRPDLWKLELTCENTNKRIPYVEIINEVISTFIKKQLGEDKTISQRLLEEQPDIEFLLPYNKHLDDVRTWLSYFQLTRLEVMEYLYPEPSNDEKLLLSLETLNLSQEQYEVIINGQLNATVDKDVLQFRQKSGLSAEETEALINMNFWEDKISIEQIEDPGDIQKFHLEFSTNLTKWKGKLHRLIRLWKLSGWSIPELDIIFNSQYIKHNNLNKSAILKLAAFKRIQTLLDLEVDVIAGILSGIPESHVNTNRLSWELILPDNWITDDQATLEDLNSNTDDEAFNLLLRLQGTFGVNTTDLLACLDLLKDNIGSQNVPDGPINIVFDISSLNHIYRYIQLYKWTEADSFEQFTSLLRIWGGGTVKLLDNPIEDIPELHSFLNAFTGIKISIDDLIIIFDTEASIEEVIEADKVTLEGDDIQDLLSSDAFSAGRKFILFFNKWLSIDLNVLDYYKLFAEISDSELETVLADIAGGSPSDSSFIRLSKLRIRLEILEFLVDKFKIDVDSLLVMAEVSQECDYIKLGFQTWQDKDWVKELAYLGSWIKETMDLRNFDLWTVLHAVEKESVLPIDSQKAFAKWKGIALAQVVDVITQTDSIKELKTQLDHIDLGKKLNLHSALIERLKTDNTIAELKDQSEMLQNAIRSKYNDNTTWEEEIQDYKNRLSSNLRDALCSFVIFNGGLRSKGFGFDNREDLYSYFLLDVGMGDCFTLPRIVAATNSLQVYIHRCLMGFERSKDDSVSVLLDIDEQEEWEWRKNYRVWEANRKIFLYPENYIEPEIRDNKTPEFKELEDELLQQKLNMEVVENAYKKYIQQIMTLAELKIAGAYYDTAYNRIYLFGRTNKQPVEYYYRHLEFLEGGGVIWSNWEKMNISIPTEDISAIRYNGKLYVFWTTYQRKDISDVSVGNHTLTKHTFDVYLNYSYLQVDKKWIAPQRVEVNYRTSYPFDPYLRIEQYEDMVVAHGNSYKFADNVDEEDIRENVLKVFEKTVYRKPYPVTTEETIEDRNILNLDFIWTDKENALEPRYRHTRGVIDAFTKDVKLKVHVPILGWLGFNTEFSFDRFDRILHYGTVGQKEKPPNIDPANRTLKFNFGPEKLEFTLDFSEDGTECSIRTGNSSGNDWIRFKNNNSEIKSGNVKLYPKIEYIPISVIENERNLIKLADQKLLESEDLNASDSVSLTNEYSSYFDSFADFFITDGTVDFADGYNDFKIQQRDMVAILTTPSDTDSNEGYKLNPEHIQMLWDKISIGLDDLLDNTTQRHVASQINYDNSFGNYFYELFFHIPMRIADHLNAAGKYREANQWYSYIYNPTAIKDNFEQLAFPTDVNWRFEALRNMSIPKLRDIYSDENAIVTYQRNPGNPHAIARLRIGAYQKNVVMKYLDNLLDWADYLFQQYTPESTSEARHLYNIVKTILGSKPENVGKCKDTKVLTYSDINVNDNSDFIYDLFAVSPPSNDGHKPGHAGYMHVVETKSHAYLENSVPNLKLNLESSKKKAQASPKYGAHAKGMKEVAKRPQKGELADKHLGMPTTPNVYVDPDVDLIFCFPHNKDFIAYWDRVDDRIYKLNNCMDINGVKKLMPAFAPEIDPALLAKMVAGGMSFDEIAAALSSQLPNYRFTFLIEKAKQYCNVVQSFGSGLLSAIERKDGEELTLLRARHEQNILTLTRKTKKNQIEQAKANLGSLLENKANQEQRRDYYASLLEEGLIEWERAEQIAKWTSGSIRITEGVLQLLSGAFRLVPQLGSPFAMKYGGLELGDSVSRFANALGATAKIADNIAILAGLEASHQRRAQDWQFQLDTSSQELKSLDEQIRSSEIALAMSDFDLELHDKNIEQYKELYEFYTTKFTDYKHYTFQVQQLQKLNRIAFNLANDLAMQAQQAYDFERHGSTTSTFIQADNWNSEKQGLLAGDKLMTQLSQLEKEYLDTDKRKIEITQHFSMLQIAPEKLLELKTIGECENFTIPEAAFDLTYPGYFRRIIKSVRLTIPCIAGPYTNIGATLALGNNKIRTDKEDDDDDGLKVFNFKGCDLIATSNAQNDGGQFELNFRDERYLPFEGAGAVSSWTLSLPKSRPAFDYNTISDVIFHVSYLADYDGSLKVKVEEGLKNKLNDINGMGFIRAFSLRHDFPTEWNLLTSPTNDTDVVLELKKEHFPYFTRIDEIDSIQSNCYIVSAADVLELKTNNEGLTKLNKMNINIPKAVGKQDYKDFVFFVKYLVN